MTSGAPPPTGSRGPRRDAVRNDAVIISAARAVFAEQGPHASMESIAVRAGLGVGTIYRRFAGKEALLDAVAALFVEELDQAAATALANPDPGAGLEEFLDFVVQFSAEKHLYAAALADRKTNESVAAKTSSRVRSLTRRAVDAGALAADVSPEDIKALIVALRDVVAACPRDGAVAAGRRFVGIHLAGLRAHSVVRLPG